MGEGVTIVLLVDPSLAICIGLIILFAVLVYTLYNEVALTWANIGDRGTK